ncbi:hypothetical protein ACFE04_009260 [Oxalis oulophora]
MSDVEVTMPNGVLVQVSIAHSRSKVSESIKKLKSAMEKDGARKIVGLSVKKIYSTCQNMRQIKVEAKSLLLCTENQCLVVHLSWQGQDFLTILANFLDLPHIAFVGFGIEHDLALMEKDLCLRCTKFVELGSLAAEVKQRPRLKEIGLSELASLFNLSLPLPDQDSFDLNKAAIEYATREAYACFYMGKAMLDVI